MDAASVGRINLERVQWLDLPATTGFGIALQFLHRIAALLIVGGVVWSALRIRQVAASSPVVRGLNRTWIALIAAQVVLGASTIWSNKAADIATAHVVVGSLTLLAGSLLSVIVIRTVAGPGKELAWLPEMKNRRVQIHSPEMAR
jgi:cytochrome c oxidase assembly protein subunit 15